MGGGFGDEYVERNKSAKLLSSIVAMFSEILSHTVSVRSVIEFGTNIGFNLQAIKQILPDVELSAIEINRQAVTELERLTNIKVYN